MSIWITRLALARLGFHTDFKISPYGIRNEDGQRRSVGLWARTMYWHGYISDICLHQHEIIDLRDRAGAAEKIRTVHDRTLELCTRALREFPDTIPCQMPEHLPDGRTVLVTSTWDTERRKGWSEEHIPTEDLPPGLEASIPGEDPVLEAFLDLAPLPLHLEDQLNTYHGRGRGRFVTDCKNRDWTHVMRHALHESQGIGIAFKPKTFTSPLLDARSVAMMIRSSAEALIRLFEDHAPGGPLAGSTVNGLPPGFQTRAEKLEESNKLMINADEEPEP